MSGRMVSHISDNARAVSVATVSRSWNLQHPGEQHSIPGWDRYLKLEFPSTIASNLSDSADSDLDSFERIFGAEVRKVQGIEEVYIRKDRDYYRIWTVLNEADVEIEDQIYDAQLRFIDQLDLPCDFAVIFRQGKDPSTIRPAGAYPISR
ncbi:MAG TPA: hypothetical protein VEH53_09545 [archaeon]|nr:hypothetical protein [archaeon]